MKLKIKNKELMGNKILLIQKQNMQSLITCQIDKVVYTEVETKNLPEKDNLLWMDCMAVKIYLNE